MILKLKHVQAEVIMTSQICTITNEELQTLSAANQKLEVVIILVVTRPLMVQLQVT